jgi:hypothetical protein
MQSLIFFVIRKLISNYFLAGASVAGASVAGAAVVSAGAAVVSAGAAVVSAGASTTVVSAPASAAFSDCLQDTTVNAAITAKLKNTFFILI